MLMVPMMMTPDVTRAAAPGATPMIHSVNTNNAMINNFGMLEEMRSQITTTTPSHNVILPQHSNLSHDTNYSANQLASALDLMPREQQPFHETQSTNLSQMSILSAALDRLQEAYQRNQTTTTMPSSQPSYQGSQQSNFSPGPLSLEQLGLGINRLNQGSYACNHINNQLAASINLPLSGNLQQQQLAQNALLLNNQIPSTVPSMLGQSQRELSSQIFEGCMCWGNFSIEPCECWRKYSPQQPGETEIPSLGLDVSQTKNNNALLMAQQSILPLRGLNHTARRGGNFPVSF